VCVAVSTEPVGSGNTYFRVSHQQQAQISTLALAFRAAFAPQSMKE
jgi:hypothetical protein